jgi:hypothetical protein
VPPSQAMARYVVLYHLVQVVFDGLSCLSGRHRDFFPLG